MAARFASGAVSGMTTAQGMPSRRACQATPWAMLPALAVHTPPASSSGSTSASALPAPRILNEPMGWRFSSLRKISHGASSSGNETSGVRREAPTMRSRAARISSMGIGSANATRSTSAQPELLRHLDLDHLAVLHDQQDRAVLEPLEDLGDL